MTELEALWLGKTNVTDKGLTYLKKLTKLTRLYLQGTQVTDAGIKELKKHLPNLADVSTK